MLVVPGFLVILVFLLRIKADDPVEHVLFLARREYEPRASHVRTCAQTEQKKNWETNDEEKKKVSCFFFFFICRPFRSGNFFNKQISK